MASRPECESVIVRPAGHPVEHLPAKERATGAVEEMVRERVSLARERLARRAHLSTTPPPQYRLPADRPFTADERDKVTILFGGLTWKHERLVEAAVAAAGYKCLALPDPDLAACNVGKQYGNNGVCNPAYFTVGNLVSWLQQREAEGMSRQEIVDRYVFLTAGGCGPCRFGTYEAEYRLALRNAGFEGFRVMTFRQDQGVKTTSGEPGLAFTLMFGLGALNALQMADALSDFAQAIRPFEVNPGATDRLVGEAMKVLIEDLRSRRLEEIGEGWHPLVWKALGLWTNGRHNANGLRNIVGQLWGPPNRKAMARCRSLLEAIDVDRLRVKPVVKVTGEFWAQTTEGDGNFRMFDFLEREGAQVVGEPVGTWVMYLIYHARATLLYRRGLSVPLDASRAGRLRARLAEEIGVARKLVAFAMGDKLFRGRYDALRRALGDVPHPLADQSTLARLAHPYYNSLARGGEGHLEVAKNLYYSKRQGAHMVLSLKPFGCMPSTQSDGVQSTIVARHRDMLFVPIETAPEGELNAHSRVQMALVEAGARAQTEFERALARTGRSLAEIRSYVESHEELRSPFYCVPRVPGVVGTAASFVLHVGERMKSDRGWRQAEIAAASGFASATEATS